MYGDILNPLKMAEIIRYGDHPLQTIKVFHFRKRNTQTLVLIHGGAWVDPNNSYDDFQEMVDYLNVKQKGEVNLIGINYRLSPDVKHPMHLIDVIRALNLIADQYTRRISIIGHSVGATLIMQLFDAESIIENGLSHIGRNYSRYRNEIEKLKQIRFKNFFLVDGIYDIQALEIEYSLYSSFIYQAFLNLEHIKHASQLSDGDLEFSTVEPTGLVIVQSVEDELLSLKQTNLFVEYLQKWNFKYELIVEKMGKHEEVYKNEQLFDIILSKN